jgi:mono/diheme cytochrome c family protein
MRSMLNCFRATWQRPAGIVVCIWLLLIPVLPSSKDRAVIAGLNEDRVLRGIDLKGQLHRLGEDSGCQGVVVVFLATECPISNRCIPVLNDIAGKERIKPSIRVYGVFSGPHVTREDAIAHSQKYNPQFPILFDASGELREQLAPTHTPHAFLLTPQGKTLYDGALDDRFAAINRAKMTATKHYLKDAIQSLLKREKIAVTQTSPVGCEIEAATVAARDAAVTFNRDIAPILYSHCSACHRQGEAGPFPLLTYQDVVKHAVQIDKVTRERIMPPWKPVAGFGRFREEAHLSDRQIATISQWIVAGMPEGPESDRPAAPQFASGWQLGEPDLILEMPHGFSVGAAGDDVHQHFVLPTGLKRDRMVEAIEFRPGNPAVVHHAGFYLDVTGAARKLDAADPDIGYAGGPGPQFLSYGKLRSWLPGMRPQRLPRGFGQLVRKGTDIMMEIHYQRSGKPETDRSSVGIYFAPPASKQIVSEIQVMDTTLEIPAGATRYHQHATYTLPTATTLLDVAPHMHFLGREVKAEAHLPDGRVEPLIWIRDWDFNWQGQYVYLKPIRLPAGTKIKCDYYFDNSAGNSRNPNEPPQPVPWGEQSKEEMAICNFLYTCDNLRDLERSYADHVKTRMQDRLPGTSGRPDAAPAKP